jgi:protocatechuate 3,4-dioxygenase, alpha subunit
MSLSATPIAFKKMSLPATPSQTVGPFFSIGLDRLCSTDICAPQIFADQSRERQSPDWRPDIPGARIAITGRILDGDDQPVPDALLEIWQADAAGDFAHPESPQPCANNSFSGFARIPTNDLGQFHFTTIKPGPVPNPNEHPQAPHLAVNLFMRGLLKHLVTRLYFPNNPANETDHILNLIDRARHSTLIATPSPNNPAVFAWDIHLQGPHETVFFDC